MPPPELMGSPAEAAPPSPAGPPPVPPELQMMVDQAVANSGGGTAGGKPKTNKIEPMELLEEEKAKNKKLLRFLTDAGVTVPPDIFSPEDPAAGADPNAGAPPMPPAGLVG